MAKHKNKRFHGGKTNEKRSHKNLPLQGSEEKRQHSSSKQKSSTTSSAVASTSHSSTCDDSESDIPGFYYDKAKKTYFKILPNTMSGVSSFVTKESIKDKENEEQRQADMKQYLAGPSSLLPVTTMKQSQPASLAKILRKFQCGQVRCENFRSHMTRHRCSTVKPHLEIIQSEMDANSPDLESIETLLPTESRDHLLCVWCLKPSITQNIQLLSVADNFKSFKPGLGRTGSAESSKAIKPLITSRIQSLHKKISSVCFAKLPTSETSLTILYTAICMIGYSPAIAYATNFDLDTNEESDVYELNLGLNMVWSCAWHNFDAKFSVGGYRQCHLIDMATRRTWTYNTHNSDPLSQTFSTTNPHTMYNGTRGGSVIVHDLRCPGKGRPKREMRQNHGISCLRLLRDENYILANDFSGTIVNWDQRMSRVVMKYKGLVNSHYQQPFYLDEFESVVSGAGSDCYSRLWDLRTGAVLQVIPPPCPVSQYTFPITVYSQNWGNSPGNSGVIMGIKDMLKVYC